MTKFIWNTLKHIPSVFSVALLMPVSAIAAEAPLQNLESDKDYVNQSLSQGKIKIA